jgi:hypothetical protein
MKKFAKKRSRLMDQIREVLRFHHSALSTKNSYMLEITLPDSRIYPRAQAWE